MTRYEQWQADDFQAEALEWADARLGDLDRHREGSPTWSRVRPWGLVMSLPTADGQVWFKAVPENSAEAVLHGVLADEAPDNVAPLLGQDEDRGWLLLADVGLSLGDGTEEDEVGALYAGQGFRTAMAAYASLQDRVTHRIQELVDRGLPDARPQAMPGVFDLLHESLLRSATDADDAHAIAVLERIATARPRVVDLAARLDGAASVDHNDLHPWNVMRGPGPVFLDWGDAMASHPYASLLVPVRIALMDSRQSAEVVLEAYEEGAGAPLDLEALDAALRLAVVARAWTWHRSIASSPGPTDYDDAALKWFERILDPSPLMADRD